jgi:phytoene dehydrogenase-like protein
MATTRDFDVVVIGAGLGGLLAAAQFLRQGRRVAVVERLAHPGGRFTAKTFQGAQVSTGAVHMLPFGSNGELAAMLRLLGVPHRIHDSEVFASFHVHGRQYACRSLLQLIGVLGPRQFRELAWIGAQMFLRAPRPSERTQSYQQWLDLRISRARSPELYAFFERVCHFTLSVDLDEVSYPVVCEITKNMLRYGPPGIVEGGCAAMTGELERRVMAGGGELHLQHEVVAITHTAQAVTGVCVRDRRTNEGALLRAPLVVSNIGPVATRRLIGAGTWPPSAASGSQQAPGAVLDQPPAIAEPVGAVALRRCAGAPQSTGAGRADATFPVREARGLKVHLLSDVSIIPHKGILYCLDTERIAGIVQPTNSDRRLAPPGKHLLITHQLMHSDDVQVEREMARADLHRLFGADLGTRMQILTMSQYRGEWPVNRVVQGEDLAPETELAGLYQVGDAVKPSGFLMVEGVAQSVNALLDLLDSPSDGSRHHRTPLRPARARALHWLVAPPHPYPES